MARILLVDDERDVVTLIKFMLEKDGHLVLCAYDGAEALAKAGVEPRDETVVLPDLVILDVLMPVMGGEAACLRLREDARTKDVPVLVLTARGDAGAQFDPKCGELSHLEKPFDPRALRELVSKILEKR